MGKKRTTTKNEPWAPAQPYIIKGMEQTQQVSDQQQPQLNKYGLEAFDTYGKLNPGAVAGIQGAQGLVNRTIAGDFLQGNPYLDRILGQQASDIAKNVNSEFTLAGRYGSGAHAGVLAKQIAEASDRLRFQNYGMERQNQINAVGQAQDLMRGNAGLLDQAAAIPWTGVAAQTGNIRQASQGYGTTTTTTRDPMGTIMGLAGAGATAFSGTNFASDERKKNYLGLVGTAPDGVTPLKAYTMKDDPTQTPQIGVMAQDVAQTNPAALGPPSPDGGATVNYGAVGMDGPLMATPPMNNVGVGGKAIPDKAVQKGGFGAYLGRVLNPDPKTTAGKIGILGQALMAGSGGAFAPLGQALMGVRQEQERLDQLQHEQAIDRRMADAAELRAANIGAPDATANQRDFEYFRALPEGPEKELMRQMLIGRDRVQASEPLVATSEGYLPRSQAAGKMPFRAPPRASAGRAAPKPPAGFILD